jgi:hypothetical protein
MPNQLDQSSRTHDLFATLLGAFAAIVLLSAHWQVDTSGPDPFYKGPLIFPLLALSLMILASLPAVWRLVKPPPNASWRLDGDGIPQKPTVVLGFLIVFLCGLVFLGLELSSWGFLLIVLYYLGHRTLQTLILVPLIVTGLVVLIFKYFLDVFFPSPLLVDFFH